MIIAHRGVNNNKDVPENSMKAFKKAIDKNYGIEFDIEITKDNVLVIHHDDNLVRMTGINKKVEDMDFEEIKKLKLLKTKEHIPTFKELLELVDGKVYLDIEIKSTKKVKLVCDLVLKELENYNGELSLKSFDPAIVRRLKKIREKTRFTQEEIAGMLGVRRLVITNIENGTRKYRILCKSAFNRVFWNS